MEGAGNLYSGESTVDICEMKMREGEISRNREIEREKRGWKISHANQTQKQM